MCPSIKEKTMVPKTTINKKEKEVDPDTIVEIQAEVTLRKVENKGLIVQEVKKIKNRNMYTRQNECQNTSTKLKILKKKQVIAIAVKEVNHLVILK
jgi:hypothetical protein